MKSVYTSCVVMAAVAAVVSVVHGQQPTSGTNTTRTSADELVRWTTELSNWGRWGEDDGLGTVNLITPEKRTQAADLVEDGIIVSLARDVALGTIGRGGPGPAFIGPPADSSRIHVNFAEQGRTSWVHEQNYGLTSTHLGAHFDAICHVAFDGKTYNGHLLTEIASEDGGCRRMAIGGFKDKVVTRAILVDIARMKGVDQLAPGTHIYREDIEAFEEWANVTFEPGDVFLYRLGGSRGSGLDPSFIPFLKERDIALFGGDTSHESFSVPGFPVAMHAVIMVPLGMPMLDNLALEELSETAARLNRWEFMFVAAPTPQTNGTGSQINPLAIF